MVSKRFTSYVIIFNAITALLTLLLNQIILITLSGNIVGNIGFFIEYDIPFRPPTMTIDPIPNYPIFALIFTLTMNTYFIIKLKGSKE